MKRSTASKKSTEVLEPLPAVSPVRHLTEADLTDDDRSRLLSCLDRGNRWFDRPRTRSSMRGPKPVKSARTRPDAIEPAQPADAESAHG